MAPKASACSVGDLGSIPGLGRSPGEGNGNPLQYSCLENPMDGGAWWATVHGVAKSQTRLRDFTFTYISNTGFSCIFNRNPKFPKSSVHTYLFQRTFQVFVLPSSQGWILNRWFILNSITFRHISWQICSHTLLSPEYSIYGRNTRHTGMGEENKRKINPTLFLFTFLTSLFLFSLYYIYFQKSKFFLVTIWSNVPDVQLIIKHSIYFCISA